MKKKYVSWAVGTFLVLALAVVSVSFAQSPNGIRGWFTGNVGLSSAYQFIFGDNTSTDIYLQKTKPNTLALGPVGAHYGFSAANKDVVGTATLVSGTVTVTFTNAYNSAPICIGTWNGTGTLTGILKAVPSTSNVAITSSVGTDTGVIQYVCYGNPN